jgi:tetratricopeptide (TPR) repeat protein
MPSHIFTRLGYWQESIATNARAAKAAKADKDFDEEIHAMDYMTYANLQLGRDSEAKRIAGESVPIAGFTTMRFTGPYGQAAMPARYALERGDWKLAMTLEPLASEFPFTIALTHFARGLGAARAGNVEMAESAIKELARLRDELKAKKNDYWVTEVEVSRLNVAAWTALAQGKKDEALTLMQTAAGTEDKNEKHIVTPGRILPARELLGEMLLELDRPADALKEFEISHVREPNRLRGFYDAAVAADKSGDKAKAKLYYTKLAEMADKNSTRRELVQAREFVKKNTSGPAAPM